MELGISMFGDIRVDETSGKRISSQQRITELMAEIKLSDEIGLDVFGIGEHHRSDYVVSNPQIILAAAATITKRIKLSSAVTVLSSSDPVCVYQDFATVDLLSGGRAEITAGRGSFTESFPLFGYDLKDYSSLFEEKLELLLNINREEVITWKGRHRAALNHQLVFPRAFNKEIQVWIAVGGTPESVQRAARLGLPLVIAIIGGDPRQFAPFYQYYRAEYLKHGHPAEKMQLGVHAHVFVGEDDKVAEMYYPYYAAQMGRIGRERGWGAYSREQFEHSRGPQGALLVGTPEQVAGKINHMKKMFGLTRFVAHMDVGGPPHKELMRSIELFGTKVAEMVR